MSNPKRIERAVQEAACNALLLKVTSEKSSNFGSKYINSVI